jgi:hypothetical protein
MPKFVCAVCQCIERTSVGDYFNQRYVEKKKPLCLKCKTGKGHHIYKMKKATVEEILQGDIIHFENFFEVHAVRDKMIDFITNDGKSIFPRSNFEKMSTNEILIIYRQLKGK